MTSCSIVKSVFLRVLLSQNRLLIHLQEIQGFLYQAFTFVVAVYVAHH